MSTQPLRIAHVHPLSIDVFGHADRDWGTKVCYYLTNMIFALQRQGGEHTLHLLTQERRRHELTVEDVRVIFHPCIEPPRGLVNHRFGRQISFGLLNALRRESTDVVHFHAATSLHAMFALVSLCCRQQKIPLVAQDQGTRPVGFVEGRLLDWGLKNTGAALAATSMMDEHYRKIGIPAERIHFQPNGFDPAIFSPESKAPPRADEPLRVLFVGRLWADKDPLTMAEGLVNYVRRGRPLHLTLIAAGPMTDETRRILDDGAVPYDFLDPVPQAELVHHHRAAHVLLQTSLGEGSNCVSWEAMASGLPVIASDAVGVRDVVGTAGILVPTRDPTAITDALQHLHCSPEAWSEYRALGLARSAAFTWDEIARNVHRIYAGVLNENTGGRMAHVGSPPLRGEVQTK